MEKSAIVYVQISINLFRIGQEMEDISASFCIDDSPQALLIDVSFKFMGYQCIFNNEVLPGCESFVRFLVARAHLIGRAEKRASD